MTGAGESHTFDPGVAGLLAGDFMSSGSGKQRILQALEQLPDDSTVEDAIERLCFLAKVEEGLSQSDAGETLSHDEAKRRLTA